VEIGPGIIWFENVRGANSYGFQDGESIAVIDTGTPGGGKRILEQIRKRGKGPGDVRHIILTHSDFDHAGSAAELREATGAKVAIHRADAEGIKDQKAQKRVKGVRGALIGLVKRFMPFRPVEPDIILEDDDEIGGLRVVHCPGHTAGSICLYKAGVALFAGDAVLGNNKGGVRGPSEAFSADILRARQSLKRLVPLDYPILLPGHGKPVLRAASASLRNLPDIP
jgi:hydroxyacylglutathione hydrolase